MPPSTRAPKQAAKRASSGPAGSSVFKARQKKLKAALAERELDALLITNAKDIHYLTGFHGEDSWAFLTNRGVTIISDFRFQEELDAVTDARLSIRAGAIHEKAIELLHGLKTIGVQAEHLAVATKAKLAKGLGARTMRDTIGLLDDLRIIKDETEIAHIQKAVRIQEKALLATLDQIGPGDSEAEIAAELEHQMKRLGAQRPSFEIIVAARANGSRPHYRPGRIKAARNQPLLIDWGCVVEGYCSDMTRTFTFGRWPKPLADVYRVVLAAQEAAVGAIAPGKRCREVDAVARRIITEAGYGDHFGHGLGHGIGLDIHEAPRLSKQSDQTLAPGMVVTVEPGVYLPGVGGVRIEDDVVVTDRSCRNLCSLPKAIDWASR